ncbi:MAG: hypothetical protein HYX66_10410 [Ignavibacteria bacterium]|nr:hypothetical protein [Ignavibacteria bacterium]
MRPILVCVMATMLAGLTTSCSLSDSPPAPSQPSSGKVSEVAGTNSSKISITGLYYNSCVPELVDVTGELHLITTRKEKADGSVEVAGKFFIKGSGTGRKTGASYNLMAQTTDEFDYTAGPPFPYTRTLDRVIRLVSGGPDDNAYVTLSIDITTNSSGVVISRTVVSSTDCR